MGSADVHHGHCPGLLQRVARGQVRHEPGGEELQRLLLHVQSDDVHRLHSRHSDSVQVSNGDIKSSNKLILSRYTSYVKPEIPLGNMQNGGAQGKVRSCCLIS